VRGKRRALSGRDDRRRRQGRCGWAGVRGAALSEDQTTADSGTTECSHCLTPVRPKDRICFACHRPLSVADRTQLPEPPTQTATGAPVEGLTGSPREVADQEAGSAASYSKEASEARNVARLVVSLEPDEAAPMPVAPLTQSSPLAARPITAPTSVTPQSGGSTNDPRGGQVLGDQIEVVAPVGPSLVLETRWGRSRTTYIVPAHGCTIGSTDAADLVIPAPFLEPVHARIAAHRTGWAIYPATGAGLVLLRGAVVQESELLPGDTIRLADRVGNFATVTVTRNADRAARTSALRGPLPWVGQSLVVGSAASCAIRLNHPLVRPRHAVLRRDQSGELWLEDRTTVAGTYVNGRRLRGRVRLSPGDVVQVGPSSARVGTTALEPLEQVAGVEVRAERASVAVDLRRKGRRQLLTDVNLCLSPASLTAVAGPSGAGKTTLMRLLSGQTAASAGTVRYNGVELTQCREAHAALMGFVPQDDVVHQDLTVGEALGYQARLRLGRDTPAAAQEASIARALGFVGLEDQRRQLVKTLSGGQRKRVSIAAELLNEPEILFLDEPTSGLDPGLDKRMMLLLRLLADQGRTVVLTTHAIAHVDVCDNLVIVGPGGFVIFAGHPDEASDWFGVPSLGDVFSLIDTAEASAKAATRLGDKTGSGPLAAAMSAIASTGTGAAGPAYSGGAVQAPPRIDLTHAFGPGGVERGPRGGADGASGIAKPAFWSPAWRETVFYQGRIFAERYVRLLTRDRMALSFSLLQGVAVALLTALVAPKPLVWSLKGSGPVFVFGCSAVWFGMINSVRELVKEQTIWRREELVGANVSAYLASKVVVLGAIAAIQSLTLLLALSLTIGLPHHSPIGPPSAGIFVTLWLANLAGMAIGLVVSGLAPSSDRAMSIVPYLLITQLVLCGVLFPLGAVTPVSWIMPARWAVSALGGIAGLSAAQLHQSSGLYPSSAAGMLGTWVMLIALAGAGVAAAARVLHRQAARWSVG
jgi:ABC transport system ATP-binding/permease protein